jgi:LysM repeat protein
MAELHRMLRSLLRAPVLSFSLAVLVLGASVLDAAPVSAELADIPYRVVSGDTARRIARRHGLTYAELQALNGNVPLERIRQGQNLIVGRGHLHVHRVRRGESLPDIAARYRVETRAIQRWNALPARLMEGTELRIFTDHEEPPSESVGRADRGSLVHGITVPPHPGFVVRERARAYMTQDAADQLLHAFDVLRDADPEAPRVEIRDASRAHGGPLDQHRSHQSGRDVDVGYFQVRCGSTCAHRRLHPRDLDAARQWRLIQTWLREGAVEYIFIDHALQEPLYEAAREAGATRAELSAWFQWPRAEDVRLGVIRHVPLHADHLHVRFHCAEGDAQCISSTTSVSANHDD